MAPPTLSFFPKQTGSASIHIDMSKPQRQRGKKLLYYLNRLEETELGELPHYLASPLFANRPQLAALLQRCLEQKSQTGLDVELLHTQLYPDHEWSPKRAHYLHLRLAQLLDHLLDFIALSAYQKDEEAKNRYRLQEATRRGWEKYVPSTYAQSIRHLPEVTGTDDVLERLQLEIVFNAFQSQRTTDGTDTHLAELLDNLDLYYYLQKLKYGCAALNGELALGAHIPLKGMEGVLTAVEFDKETAPPVLLAYAACFEMLQGFSSPETGDSAFQSLQNLLVTRKGLPEPEAKDLFTYAINYCTLRIYAEAPGFDVHMVTLYEALLDQNLLTVEGKLSKVYYKNIVALMCRLKKLEWAEKFVESYQSLVAGDEDGLAYLYNRAVIRFHHQDYSGTIRLLYNEINQFEDVLFGIAARIYLCRALWMQDDWEGLGTTLDAFRVYLGRNKEISQLERKLYAQFVKVLRKVLRIVSGDPDRMQQRLQAVGKSMESAGNSSVFHWLRSIIQQKLSES